MTKTPTESSARQPTDTEIARRERQAALLRENLRRRKAQARERQGEGSKSDVQIPDANDAENSAGG